MAVRLVQPLCPRSVSGCFYGGVRRSPSSFLLAALPLGGRVKIDPWNDQLSLIKSKPVGTVAEREKMPFEVTPFMPYLMRYGADAAKPVAASAQPPQDVKPGVPPDPTKP